MLKNLLFRAAECTYKPKDPSLWPPVETYSEVERYENSSVFLTLHDEHLADGSLSKFATVSTTVMIMT